MISVLTFECILVFFNKLIPKSRLGKCGKHDQG